VKAIAAAALIVTAATAMSKARLIIGAGSDNGSDPRTLSSSSGVFVTTRPLRSGDPRTRSREIAIRSR
jgi:hypothetical protein